MSLVPVTLEQLLAYADGTLADADMAIVEQAVLVDAGAARTVALYRQARNAMLTDNGVPPSPAALERARSIFPLQANLSGRWFEAVDRLIARLVFDSRVTRLGVRSADRDRRQWTFETHEIEVDLQVHRNPMKESSPTWRMAGQVSGESGESSMPVALVLMDDMTQVQETESDALGSFQFDVPSGRYQLLLNTSAGVVEIPNIEMQ